MKKQNKQMQLFKQLIPDKNVNVLSSLHVKPEKETGNDMPHTQIFEANYLQQCDVLYLPEDKGYKFLLTVVDAHSKKVDAQPIKDEAAETIVKAFKKIYERDILEMPHIMDVDGGSEFKKSTLTYFDKHKVIVRKSQPDRHRMQSLIEYKNKVIGGNIFRIQNQEELETGKPCKKWVDIIPKLIKLINENLPKPINKELSKEPYISKKNEAIVPIGAQVRIILEVPEAIASTKTNNNKKLGGTFRESDIRWSRTTHKVTNFIIKPGYPILYTIDDKPIGYTRQQIQPINNFV